MPDLWNDQFPGGCSGDWSCHQNDQLTGGCSGGEGVHRVDACQWTGASPGVGLQHLHGECLAD